ncbi:hypothetical protein OEZ86_001076 [Tetradesmus obliquus]|nr:hypothetical protein OEZ86_001076 [Tetradesmus obliquus]
MADADTFVTTVQRLQQQGRYQLASMVLQETGAVVAVAGYRIGECLANGRELYVYDLIVDSEHQARGHGQALLHWLKEQAAAQQCNRLWLVSGKQRTGAHAFYAASGMDNFGFVFMQDVSNQAW